MDNKLKELVKKIKYYRNWTTKEVAESIGYSRAHLTNKMNAGHDEGIYNLLMTRFADELGKFDSATVSESKPKYKKAPTIADVDAFLVGSQIRQEAIMQTSLEFLSEVGASVLGRSSTALLADLKAAVLKREQELRELYKSEPQE